MIDHMGNAFFQKDGRILRGGTEVDGENVPWSRRGLLSSESWWMVIVRAELAYLISFSGATSQAKRRVRVTCDTRDTLTLRVARCRGQRLVFSETPNSPTFSRDAHLTLEPVMSPHLRCNHVYVDHLF